MKEKIYKLTESELRSLIEDSEFLKYLMDEGVDNWDWYEDACNSYNEMLIDEDIEAALDNYLFEEVEHEDLDPSVELNIFE